MTATKKRLTLVRDFIRQYEALERKSCDPETWISLKLGCTLIEALKLIRAARIEGRAP